MSDPKKIAITMGDPGGVGPEVIISALTRGSLEEITPVLVGDPMVFKSAADLLGKKLDLNIVHDAGEAARGWINLIQAASGLDRQAAPSASSGHAAVACIKIAAEEAGRGAVNGIVTAPISKESLKLAGYPWPGHTEFLADLTGTKEFAMMLVGGPLRVLLVTIHEAIARVPGLITRDRVLSAISLAARATGALGISAPRIGIAGLNPHAGEAGLFGDEELREICPAIADAKQAGYPVSGPYPPDIIFHKAYSGQLDIIVAMYHDQGLIPLKMIAFDRGVNVTVGLPIVRTSPDHGTAFDIAWKGVARSDSMIEALRLAARLKPA